MLAAKILSRLEMIDETGPAAQDAARMGFLEWVFQIEAGKARASAEACLIGPEAQVASSDAALEFLNYMGQAARDPVFTPKRSRRQRYN